MSTSAHIRGGRLSARAFGREDPPRRERPARACFSARCHANAVAAATAR